MQNRFSRWKLIRAGVLFPLLRPTPLIKVMVMRAARARNYLFVCEYIITGTRVPTVYWNKFTYRRMIMLLASPTSILYVYIFNGKMIVTSRMFLCYIPLKGAAISHVNSTWNREQVTLLPWVTKCAEMFFLFH